MSLPNETIIYHRSLCFTMLTKDSIIRTLERHGKTLRGFGVKHIELFGSYARGEQHRGSDIDFLVTYEKDRGTYIDMLDVLHFLEDTFHKKIDVVKPHLIRRELRHDILGGERVAARI